MSRRDEQASGGEFRRVAEQLSAAMTAAVRQEPVGQVQGSSKSTAEVLAAVASGGTAGRPSESSQAAGALSAVVQNLEEVTRRMGGPVGWLTSLNPVLGLMRLFGGGRQQEPVAFPRFERPAREDYLGGIRSERGWAAERVDYGAGWLARPQEERREAAAHQVTVQVQAMDSRSFLDHRDEIAAAVRQALLESHSLGDVMNERW